MPEAICTLFEKDYHHGVAALVNSLVKAGFCGKVWAGYRGDLPHWAKTAQVDGQHHSLKVTDTISIVFVKLTTDIHLAHYKPAFMRYLLEGPAAEATQLHYLDPDIVLKGKWPTFARWAKSGIAVVEDPRGYMPERHPTRLGWIEWLEALGETNLTLTQNLNRYYSSGYVGITPANLGFIKKWESLIEHIAQSGHQLDKLCMGAQEELFYLPDQEAMNIALMCQEALINGVGQEGMDFAPYGNLLSHAIGSRKPWRGKHIQLAVRGYAPTRASRAFFKNTSGPIKSFATVRLYTLKLGLRLAVLVARIFRPTHYRFTNP